jgi:hypothetical protein
VPAAISLGASTRVLVFAPNLDVVVGEADPLPSDGLRGELYPGDGAGRCPETGPTVRSGCSTRFATRSPSGALENGAQITWLSRHLGHSSLQVTTDVYGHWSPGSGSDRLSRWRGSLASNTASKKGRRHRQ